MNSGIHNYLLFRAIYQPDEAFAALAEAEPSPWTVLVRYSFWLLLMPPLFAFMGAANFGWRLGAEEPLTMPLNGLALISAAYLGLLLFGLLSTAVISCWMAATYGANRSFGRHLALITIIGEPLAVGSMVHIYPHVFINILVLIPAMMWSMYLLYKGVPVALETPPERGMLMASSLVGWLLVAAVSLLGLSMGLWVAGVGPLLGV